MPALDRTSKAAEDTRNPSWREEVGYPTKFMLLSGNQIQLCPPMAGLTPTIGVLEAPADLVLTAMDGEPDERIPVAHHPHLATGALHLLLSKNASKGDISKAALALQTFMQLIGVPDAGGKKLSTGR